MRRKPLATRMARFGCGQQPAELRSSAELHQQRIFLQSGPGTIVMFNGVSELANCGILLSTVRQQSSDGIPRAPHQLPRAPPLRSCERHRRIGRTAENQGRPEANHAPLREIPMLFGGPVALQPVCLGPAEQQLFAWRRIPSLRRGEQIPSPAVARPVG